MGNIKRKGLRGQGLVEFALAFPIFLAIILGIFAFWALVCHLHCAIC